MSKIITVTIDVDDLDALVWVLSVAETDRDSYPVDSGERAMNQMVQRSIDHVSTMIDAWRAVMDTPMLGPAERSVQ